VRYKARLSVLAALWLVVCHVTAGSGDAVADFAPTAPDAGAQRAAAPAEAPTGELLLGEALAARYGCNLTARVRLVLRDRRGRVRTRELQTVTSHAGGRMRSLGRVLEPASLRGMTILTLEERGRADDVFVFLPQLGRARRIATSQRGDAFLGSDLSYDDFERHRAEDYQVLQVVSEEADGAHAWRVVSRPRRPGWARVDFVVAASDRAILEVAYHRKEGRAARIVSSPRAGIVAHGDARIPTRLLAASLERGTSTEVEVLDLEIDAEIDERIFSLVTLEARRRLVPLQGDASAGRERAEAD
jgi:hypothetical protein